MKFIESFVMAMKSLSSNKLRSLLTMLGIIIGVGAVISLMSIGRGAQAQLTSIYEQQGTNVIFVQPRNPQAPGVAGLSTQFATPSLTLNDAAALEDIPSVLRVAPANENFVEVIAGTESVTAMASGITPAYQQAYAYSVATGQFISERNNTRRDMVVVLGDKVVKDLFGAKNPIGQEVKLNGKRFTVIGTLQPKGGGFLGYSLDDIVMVPITTFQARLYSAQTPRGEDAVQSIAVQVSSPDAISEVEYNIKTVLRERHKITGDKKNDFAVISQQQILDVFGQVSNIFTLFLGAVAGISLIVGGIGIMNIMLVSVTERTREIGIRKAVGAKRRDILLQFLLEAAILSFIGGGIGILGGWAVSQAISLVQISGMTIHSVVSPDIVILAISVAIFIGLVSGIYPALRASRLNPIDALHFG